MTYDLKLGKYYSQFLLILFQELEKETTERVKSLFDDIDRVLYADNGVSSSGKSTSLQIYNVIYYYYEICKNTYI